MAAQIVQNPQPQNLSEQNQRSHHNAAQYGDTPVNGDLSSTMHQRNGERSAAGWDQNPQLLQWRANNLLDEMMLGAIDIAASDSAPPPSPSRPVRNRSADYHAAEGLSNRRTAATQDSGSIVYPTTYPTNNANGVHHTSESYNPDSYHTERYNPEQTSTTVHDMVHEEHRPRDPQDEWSRPAWHFAEPTIAPPLSSPQLPPPSPLTPAARAATLQEHTRYHQTPPATTSGSGRSSGATDIRTTAVGAPPARSFPPPSPVVSPSSSGHRDTSAKNNTEQWVFAAEQRYQQIAARHQATPPETIASGGGSSPVNKEGASWVDSTDALFESYATDDLGYTPGVASNAAPYPSSARQRMSQAARRSTLLPRMSNLDPRALQQEMVLLQSEIEQALPAGHDSRVRALHLLQKAYTILQADPLRSAEVEYYLQQVRTIGQRVQETLHWSNLYRSRLSYYLVAWVVLSLIVISSRYVYHNALVATIAGYRGSDPTGESLLPHNLLTILTVFFAGSLGGAVGALINMRQYAQVQQGFFDRKYSLRGLILPLIGAIVGLVLCLGFGIIYYLFQVDPAVNLLLGALPAVAAFAFGAAQEFIYGTRD